jgi:peptidoglycan hydrolase-like protein with peptidoglycan-binding domain
MTKVLAAAAAAGLTLALVPPAMAAGREATTSQVRPQVAGLQVALRAWGLYDGPIDAIDGPGTRAAVRAFQQRAGLPVDGVAGRATRAALGPLGRPLQTRRVLQQGAFGWDVSVLQFALTRAGVYDWPVDGFFGPETVSALERWQQARGLVADGVAGPDTLAGLGRLGMPAPRVIPKPPATKYTVRSGDSLIAIADRFGTTLPAIARLNKLDPARVLLIGTKLRLPVAAAPTRTASDASASEVRGLVDSWAGHYGVDPALARALAWMESGYQTNLTSDAGAWGVMQIIPSAWNYVEDVLIQKPVPRTPAGNVQVGVALIRQLLQEFGGDERLAVGAWYQGARAVREHGLYPETKVFVDNVLALRTRV